MPNALILGASGTLGGAIARELIARGYSVGLHYHSRKEPCEVLAAEAAAKNAKAALYPADFSDAAAPAALATAFLKDFSTLDALVWSAGIVRDAPVLTLKDDDLLATLNIDLRAFFLTLKAFSRQFIKQKSGSVVALSSHAAVAGRAGGAAYAMAHGGMLALVKSAAREWGSVGVRVNAVLPPFVQESAMGRTASPEFVAAAKAKRVLKSDTDGARSVSQTVAALLENASVSGQVVGADSRISI
ncbi:MAG TPA: SDR family NAD(P)-dependent oxidoreductase [Planctomycetota bacterium]|nr:SDR family NAD(P)-dependent oxidoreductase [Planctomycetota bacterium]